MRRSVIPLPLPLSPALPFRPFLRFVGSKRQLVPELLKHAPETFRDYHEPFLGGGALFFALAGDGRLKSAHLNDANTHLIRTFAGIRTDVDAVIKELRDAARHHAEGPAFYYQRMRGIDLGDLARLTSQEVAAWFIYLNKTCFNGLWRVNKAGRFNVPRDPSKGASAILSPAYESVLHAADRALESVDTLDAWDFRAALVRVRRNDLVYCDPPYIPASDTANFTSYTKSVFGPAEQEALRDEALRLAKKGAHVILSNSDTEGARKLYDEKRFTLHEVAARRNVNSDATKRGPVGELIIVPKGKRR